MPKIGLGVLFAKDDGEVEQAVKTAIGIGYRKIDTASAYQNEKGVGRAILKSEISRKDIFLTTKVWNSEQGYDGTLRAFDKSLKKLQTDYVDLYLIHWPVRTKFKETYRAMEKIYAEGRARAIGVCNFGISQLEDLMQHSNIVPAVNQVEMHPYLTQNGLRTFAQENQIQLEAWRPIMMGKVLHIPELVAIGNTYDKTPVQVTLRWLVQRGVAAIPKSITPKRIQENLDVFDFELTHDEMKLIEGLNQNKSLGEDLSDKV